MLCSTHLAVNCITGGFSLKNSSCQVIVIDLIGFTWCSVTYSIIQLCSFLDKENSLSQIVIDANDGTKGQISFNVTSANIFTTEVGNNV